RNRRRQEGTATIRNREGLHRCCCRGTGSNSADGSAGVYNIDLPGLIFSERGNRRIRVHQETRSASGIDEDLPGAVVSEDIRSVGKAASGSPIDVSAGNGATSSGGTRIFRNRRCAGKIRAGRGTKPRAQRAFQNTPPVVA